MPAGLCLNIAASWLGMRWRDDPAFSVSDRVDRRVLRLRRYKLWDFNTMVSERFLGSLPDLPLAPFMPCTVAIDSDVALTGYIERYLPEADAGR
jgi:hypothetical protein